MMDALNFLLAKTHLYGNLVCQGDYSVSQGSNDMNTILIGGIKCHLYYQRARIYLD